MKLYFPGRPQDLHPCSSIGEQLTEVFRDPQANGGHLKSLSRVNLQVIARYGYILAAVPKSPSPGVYSLLLKFDGFFCGRPFFISEENKRISVCSYLFEATLLVVFVSR